MEHHWFQRDLAEVVCTDYIKMVPSRSGYTYVLMHLDKFSRAVQFLSVDVATGLNSVRGMGSTLWFTKMDD